MALSVKPLAIYLGVIGACALVTVSAGGFTADTVGKMAAATEVASKPLKPSYIARLPEAKAEALNIATATPVAPTTQVATLDVTATPVAAAPPATTTPANSYRVVASGANVRSGAENYPQVFTLSQGTWVDVSRSGAGLGAGEGPDGPRRLGLWQPARARRRQRGDRAGVSGRGDRPRSALAGARGERDLEAVEIVGQKDLAAEARGRLLVERRMRRSSSSSLGGGSRSNQAPST
ncbi:MAG: hypothetical protein QM702_10945 [Rubrivivax sp.]